MADSILRLKVENREYDSKLRHASEGLQRYVDNCRKVGGTLAVVERETLDYVNALGTMDTVATGAIQKNREMTRVITDLTIQYRQLTDEEKYSPFGKAMAASIQTLTERAAVARDAMKDVNDAINHMSSDTRVFDQLAGGMTLAASATQTYIGVTKLLGIETENSVEVIAKLQAAMSVTSGLTQAQTLLQRESAVMQGIQAIQTKALAAANALNARETAAATAAQSAFNAVAKANPYVLLATVAAAAGTAIFAFAKHNRAAAEETKVNEEAMKRAKAAAESYHKTVTSTYANLMVKYDELKRSWMTLSSTQERRDWIEKNKKALDELGVSVNNIKDAESVFESNTSSVVDGFRRRAEAAALAARMVDLYQQQMDIQLNANERAAAVKVTPYHTFVSQAPAEGYVKDNEPDQYGRTTYNQGRYTKIGNSTRYVYTPKGAEEYNKNLADIDPELKNLKQQYQTNAQLIERYNNRLSELEQGFNTGATSGTDKKDIFPVGSVAELTQRMQELQEQQKLVTNNDDWLRYQQQIEQIQNQIKAIKGETETLKIDRVLGKSITTNAGLNEYINSIKESIETADFGSALYESLTSRLADATMLQNLVKESLGVGLGTALFDVADEVGQDFWDRVLSPEGVANSDWQAIADVINEKRKELGLDAITLDFSTGNIRTSKNAASDKTLEQTQLLVSGMSQVNNGLKQMGITLPDSVDKFMNVTQGVISVINGAQSIIQAFSSTTATSNVAALSTNTSAMLALTTAINVNTAAQTASNTQDVIETAIDIAFAHGGIVPHAAHGYAVPGTHYSGDTTPILANAGEVILNRAQQGNIASQLEDSGADTPLKTMPFVTGQTVFLGLNNYLKGAGFGEVVTVKMLKQMGLMR